MKRVVEWVRLYEPEPEPTVEPEPEPRKKPRLTEDQKARIVALSAEGKGQHEIARTVGCSQSNVSTILARHRAETAT